MTEKIEDSEGKPQVTKKLSWRLFVLYGLPILTALLFLSISPLWPSEPTYPRIEISYQRINIPISNWIDELEFDHDGNLWVGTSEGICFLHGKSCIDSEFRDSYIFAITTDPTGRLWVGTGDAGIKIFNDGRWTTYDTENSQLIYDSIRTIEFDDQQRAWIGTFSGLSIFDGEEWLSFTTTNSLLPADFITAIAFDKEGNVWIGTFGEGIIVSSIEAWITQNDQSTSNNQSSIELISFGKASYADNIEYIFVDQEGNVWIGNWDGIQIYKYEDHIWESEDFITTNSLYFNNTYTIKFDAMDRAWIGGEKLSIFNEGQFHIFQPETSNLNLHPIRDISFDSNGFAWLATEDGLYKLSIDLELPISISEIKANEQEYRNSMRHYEDNLESREALLYPLGITWLILFTWEVVPRTEPLHDKKLRKRKLLIIIASVIIGIMVSIATFAFGTGLSIVIHYATETQGFFLWVVFPWLLGLGAALLIWKVLREKFLKE